jgi:hypothetical protein
MMGSMVWAIAPPGPSSLPSPPRILAKFGGRRSASWRRQPRAAGSSSPARPREAPPSSASTGSRRLRDPSQPLASASLRKSASASRQNPFVIHLPAKYNQIPVRGARPNRESLRSGRPSDDEMKGKSLRRRASRIVSRVVKCFKCIQLRRLFSLSVGYVPGTADGLQAWKAEVNSQKRVEHARKTATHPESANQNRRSG